MSGRFFGFLLGCSVGVVDGQAPGAVEDDALSQLNVSYAQGSSALGAVMSQVFINLFPRYGPTFGSRKDDDGDPFFLIPRTA